MSNSNNNTSQGGGPSQGGGGGSYHTSWPFSFNAAAVATNTPNTAARADGYSNLNGASSGRPRLSGGNGSAFPPPASRRYGPRGGDPYASTLAHRRQNNTTATTASSRDKRTQGSGQRQGNDPERKRVVVACTRCRKRKIRCSGDDGQGGPCTNCKNASEPSCLFMRVQAGSLDEVRKKEEEKRMAATAVASTFTYDIDTCRQYQSRGAASIGAGMSAHSTAYGAPSGAAFGVPGNMMYSWAPGLAAAYSDNTGHGASGTNNGVASTGYGIPYHGMPYHGIPSPDTGYMGDNDLMERPTTTSMTDAGGAFALQSMSAGLPTSGGSQAGAYGHNHNHGHHGHSPMGSTQAPRSIPGAPNVLGSTRGVPQSSVFSASRGAATQQYPSPVTTPITSGVSPVWSGYDQSPYGPTGGMPPSIVAQSLDRLPDLYSATPPPPHPPTSAGGGAAPPSGSGSHRGSLRGEDEGLNSGGGRGEGSNNSGSHHHHHQSPLQHQHFGYD